jgi:hypothetical protein
LTFLEVVYSFCSYNANSYYCYVSLFVCVCFVRDKNGKFLVWSFTVYIVWIRKLQHCCVLNFSKPIIFCLLSLCKETWACGIIMSICLSLPDFLISVQIFIKLCINLVPLEAIPSSYPQISFISNTIVATIKTCELGAPLSVGPCSFCSNRYF